jgi:transcriptional regulator with XRE-family HTH domain
VTVRYDDIGNRLKAFRLGSGLSAEEIAGRLGISRAALYRFEKGEVVKIETLERLSELLGVSLPTLLGVGVEYVSSAVTYFERIRQLEEVAEHIIVLAGPISYLLASDAFHEKLSEVLVESVPSDAADRARTLSDIAEIMEILARRKARYRERQPAIVNLIAGTEIARFLRNGFAGRPDISDEMRDERRAFARQEVQHFIRVIEEEAIGVQIGVVPDALPHTGFQIFRQPDRQVLTLSPFRLGEEPNVRSGIAMITSAPEALTLHQKATEEMWQRAHKSAAAAKFLRKMLTQYS